MSTVIDMFAVVGASYLMWFITCRSMFSCVFKLNHVTHCLHLCKLVMDDNITIINILAFVFCVIFSFNHLIPLSRVFFVCVHVLSYFHLFLYHNMLSFESLKLTKQLRADVWLAINVLGFVWGFFFFLFCSHLCQQT